MSFPPLDPKKNNPFVKLPTNPILQLQPRSISPSGPPPLSFTPNSNSQNTAGDVSIILGGLTIIARQSSLLFSNESDRN